MCRYRLVSAAAVLTCCALRSTIKITYRVMTVSMSVKGTHVLKSISGGWGVQRTGAERAVKVFDSQQRAIELGRALAKRDGAPLYIHRADGTILSATGSSVASGTLSIGSAATRERSVKGNNQVAGGVASAMRIKSKRETKDKK